MFLAHTVVIFPSFVPILCSQSHVSSDLVTGAKHCSSVWEHVFRPLHCAATHLFSFPALWGFPLLSDQSRPEQASAHPLSDPHEQWEHDHLRVCLQRGSPVAGRDTLSVNAAAVGAFPTLHGWKSTCGWVDSFCARSAMPGEPLKFPMNGNKRD